MVASNNPRFSLGQVVATPGAIQALEVANQSAAELLTRHVNGDWGNLDEDDKQANEDALKDGSRIFSAYTLSNQTKIWIITEAENDDGNRASTCLLLPDEY